MKNLLKIRSIVTIITTIVFAYLSIKGNITPAEFIGIFGVIIGFYYGTKQKEV